MRKTSVAIFIFAVIIGLSTTAARADTIDIPQASGGFSHGTDYVYGIPAINLLPGDWIGGATLELLNFGNWREETSTLNIGFVQDWGGATSAWTTMFSQPSNTNIFWILYDMSATAANYGPTSIESADLAFMTSNFGIYLDPNCHFYGTLQLDYRILSEGTPVPEPASLLLLGSGLGVLGLAAYRRRRK
jgi:hypothetical protein